jgi:deoxycytidine triphosphate deaminase
MLIVLVGARGTGKTTLLESLRKRPGITILQPSTTRAPRSSNDREYDFREQWNPDDLAWTIDVDSAHYGMRRSEVEKARSSVCFTVFDPLNIEKLDDFRKNSDLEIMTIGLGTITTREEQVARVSHDANRIMEASDFERANEIVLKCDVVLTGNAQQVLEASATIGSILSSRGGTLVKDQIRSLVRAGTLLAGADPEQIRGASYDLHVGDQAWCQGQIITLSDEKPSFEIPAYSYAIVSAREMARLPPFVTGRFDLKVSLFFDGVILSNGPQVDPGYKGALFCMLFNGNSLSRGITRGFHLSTIEFTTTTRMTESYKQEYQFLERLEKFMNENSMRSPGGTIMQLIDDKSNDLNRRVKDYEKSL